MDENIKIPILVGVTGHRNVVEQDVGTLKSNVRKALLEIKNICGDSPVAMMSGMAQGADMLCAEVAFELNIDVYAVLPFDKERFFATFDDKSYSDKLYAYLDKCKRIIYVPDVEQNKDWLSSQDPQADDDSYWYRQVGVYMAQRAHLMIALWDGKAPVSKYGCGTVEVICFALEHNYLHKDHIFKSVGMVGDSAVVWIKTDRAKQGKHVSDNDCNEWLIYDSDAADKFKQTQFDEENKPPYFKRFLSVGCVPDFLAEAVKETDAYNKSEYQQDEWCHLWSEAEQLDDYRKNIRAHFVKADKLSYAVNQPKYKRSMLTLALLGALIALTFMIYDDAALPWMIIPCTIASGVIIALSLVCQQKSYHANYIKYRAFAEALRIQFYLSLSLNETAGLTNVCDMYSWSQKVKHLWIRKAIHAIDVISDSKDMPRDVDFLNQVKEAWVGNGKDPEGQLRYHSRKMSVNKNKRDKLNNLTQVLTWTTVALYVAILVLEIVSLFVEADGTPFFWTGTSSIGLTYRNIGVIVVGTLAATSLLLSSYWGKLSFDRLYDDNDKMSKLYRSAYSRWSEITDGGIRSDKEFENFVKEIAREEIVENGIWCSYIEENTLDINL